MRKIQFYKVLFLVCFWILCTVLIVIYEGSILGFESEIDGEYYSFYRILFIAVLNCIMGGTILGSIEVFYFSKLFRKKPLGKTLLTKTFVYILFILFFTSISRFVIGSYELNQSIFSREIINHYIEYLTGSRVWTTMMFWGLACMSGLFILQVSDKFGQGVLINFMLGKYHRPKEEDRIFMFMDLKSSTTYAEQLGHIKYSQFIQDCFFDITDVITKHEAKIYQYVGDEVVLTWSVKEGIENSNCINTFFAYDNVLKEKKKYYKTKYGIIPEFKAGLHLGKVTVAEVGEIKKELAFHGDAINTAARIQAKCNDLQKRLLISEGMKSKFEDQKDFDFSLIGDVELKGKAKSINLFEVKMGA